MYAALDRACEQSRSSDATGVGTVSHPGTTDKEMAEMTPIQTVSRPTELDDPPTLRDAARAIPDRERGDRYRDREPTPRTGQARFACVGWACERVRFVG